MIGRITPRIRDRQPRLRLISGRHWLAVGAVLCAAAVAGQQAPPVPLPPPPVPQPASSSDASDDDFIEFLGTDDVGDAAWWEFLKQAPPRGESSPAPPPQDAKQ